MGLSCTVGISCFSYCPDWPFVMMKWVSACNWCTFWDWLIGGIEAMPFPAFIFFGRQAPGDTSSSWGFAGSRDLHSELTTIVRATSHQQNRIKYALVWLDYILAWSMKHIGIHIPSGQKLVYLHANIISSFILVPSFVCIACLIKTCKIVWIL